MTPPLDWCSVCPARRLEGLRLRVVLMVEPSASGAPTPPAMSRAPEPVTPRLIDSPSATATPEVLTYSVKEAAQVLGVKVPTIYRLIYRRLLRPVPGLRCKRIPKRQVHAFMNKTDT